MIEPMNTQPHTFNVDLSENDLSFLESEAESTQSSPQDIIKDAIALYRKRTHEMKEEMGESCCGGGCGGR